jgi:thiamine-phosphate pyrophosphorylase
LYTFVDTSYLGGRAPELVARQLCDGGSDLIQLRAKGATKPQVRDLAERILPVTSRAGVGLVINDFPEIAAEIGAPLCHLGQEDFAPFGHVDEVRAGLGQSGRRARLGIGLSTHAPAQAEAAVRAGADYIAIGPVFPTATKPKVAPVTLDYVRWAAANVTVPWFAIGGVTLENVDSVLEAGARGICVVSAILNAQDVVKACRQFGKRLERNVLRE